MTVYRSAVVKQIYPLLFALHRFFSSTVGGVTVFILSRTQPPPTMARFRTNGSMKVVQWDDLRMSLEETVEFTALKTSESYDLKRIKILHEKTDGWVASLSLMLEAAH